MDTEPPGPPPFSTVRITVFEVDEDFQHLGTFNGRFCAQYSDGGSEVTFAWGNDEAEATAKLIVRIQAQLAEQHIVRIVQKEIDL